MFNKFELETLKRANKKQNIMHIVSVVYKNNDLELHSYVFYEDDIGLKARQVDADLTFGGMEELSYKEREEHIMFEVKLEVNYDIENILQNKRVDDWDEVDYVGGMLGRTKDLYDALIMISYKGSKKINSDDIYDYQDEMAQKIDKFIRPILEDKSIKPTEAWGMFLKEFEIDIQDLKKYLKDKKTKFRFKTKKEWV